MQTSKGVTLVTLVITIIILFILAGVAISLITGGEGLFDKANKAAGKYNQAAQNEEDTMQFLIDKLKKPMSVTLFSSNVATKTFTLTAEVNDAENIIISKYVFYIDGEIKEEIETSSETVTTNILVGEKNTKYRCKVRVYNSLGEFVDSNEIEVKTQFLVEVGDFVNYDAGTWETNGTGNSVYKAGQSRNENATGLSLGPSQSPYKGWRIWDIDETTGIIKLISAGHPELWSQPRGTSSDLLKNKNCSMYLNEYSDSACVLTGEALAECYNKNFDPDISIPENKEIVSSNLFPSIPKDDNRKTLFINGVVYYIATKANTTHMYCISATGGLSYMSTGNGVTRKEGVRIVITLKNTVTLKHNVGSGSETKPLQLVNSANL